MTTKYCLSFSRTSDTTTHIYIYTHTTRRVAAHRRSQNDAAWRKQIPLWQRAKAPHACGTMLEACVAALSDDHAAISELARWLIHQQEAAIASADDDPRARLPS